MGDLTAQLRTGFQPATLSKSMNLEHHLSTEIWVMIFEQLYELSPNISRLRLISRYFNDTLIPITYRKIRLDPSLFWDSIPDANCLRVLGYIRSYTTYVVIDCKLIWDAVVPLLMQCRRLKDLECKHFEKIKRRDLAARGAERPLLGLPRQIRKAFIRKLPDIRLHCDFSADIRAYCDFLDAPRATRTAYGLDIPTHNLVSLKLLSLDPQSWSNRWTSHMQRIMSNSTKLEVLHLRCSGRRYTDNMLNPFLNLYMTPFPPGKKFFPPIRELILEGVWQYTEEEVVAFWDFSKLSILKLRYIDIDYFAKNVPSQQMSGLTKFEFLVKDDTTMRLTERPAYWVNPLMTFMDKIERLEELVLQCYHPHWLMPVIEKHKSSLRVLKLRDLNTSDPRATAEDVEKLRTMCPYLNDLVLDIKVAEDARRQEGWHSF